MTKKEQAIEDFRTGLSDILTWNSFATSTTMNRIQELVHAIDDADREERGVVDVQEIKKCYDCKFHFEGICQKVHIKSVISHNAPPSWCPRRKENRK